LERPPTERNAIVRLALTSVVLQRNNLMPLPKFIHSTRCAGTFLVAGIFVALVVALLGFVYLKTNADRTMRSDRMIASQMDAFATLSPERRLDAISDYLKQDPPPR
jgi:hypothetical protein